MYSCLNPKKRKHEVAVPYAICNDKKYTAEQLQVKKELRNKSKKKSPNEKLLFPGGCTLCFRSAANYVMKNGTRVKRRAHLSHIGEHDERICGYMQKYSSSGGESKEHMNAKFDLST